MRLGLISDIHGNRPALDAVVAELEKEDLDQIVCLGDVAVGPQPGEALAGIRALDSLNVMGNWDACFLEGMPEAKDEVAPEHVGQFVVDHEKVVLTRPMHLDRCGTIFGFGRVVAGHLEGHDEAGSLVGGGLGDEDVGHYTPTLPI